MLDRLRDLETEYVELGNRLADPALMADQDRYADAARRYKELEALVSRGRSLRQAHDDLVVAKEMYADASAEDREMLRAEIDQAEAGIERLDEELKLLLLPRDPNEGRNVIVEIRGAEGGEEANLFARDLFEMYKAYAGRMGWWFELLGSRPSDLGGFADVTFLLKGDGVWTRMKFEAGPHRVQRVPITESQGRVHTSSATVSVLPEADEIEIAIEAHELQVDVFRSSGPGGQSVNTTDSAVRITHKPSGIVVSMQDEKSQIQNRAKALQVLRARLLQHEQQRQSAELSDARKGQIGGGGRSEKIRTYNFKENRLSDHRIGLTLYKLDKVLSGELDEVSDALVAEERSRQLHETDGAGVAP
jgi:peptide chain release factor 1